MLAGRCRTFEEPLGICSLSGGQSHEPHPDAIGSQQDSVRGLARIRKKAICEASLCVRMLGFHARSERETEEAGFQSHSRHIDWVQHIDYTVLRIRPIGQDASPLLRCGIQRRKAVHSTECCRRCDFESALLQRCHWGTQTHREAANQRWKFWMSNGGAIGWRFTCWSSEAKDKEVTRIGWPWDVTWRYMDATGLR